MYIDTTIGTAGCTRQSTLPTEDGRGCCPCNAFCFFLTSFEEPQALEWVTKKAFLFLVQELKNSSNVGKTALSDMVPQTYLSSALRSGHQCTFY